MRILTGMSGFSYKEWKGLFYPADLPADGMLGYYASQFPVVEINSTFYRMPTEKTLLDWARQVPEGFTFAIKASRRITHNQRLQNVDRLTQYLLQTTSALERARGPILFLLPPNMKKDMARLQSFLPLLPRVGRVALECRHASWFDDEVYSALRAREIALVASEQEDRATPIQATAPWGYVRLHRPGYSDDDLKSWLDRIRSQNWSEAYVFFQHEESIAGPQIGLKFRDLAAETIHD
jgi:uncharacterized protein YecE (DUF72 family)